MAEQGVAPRPLCLRKQHLGRLGPPPVPIAGWELPWLDVDGLKGGANAGWIGARSGSSVRLPEERSRGEKRHQWSAGRRACFAKHAAPQGAKC